MKKPRLSSQGFSIYYDILYYLKAACAAAKRAIGTRNGEQLT